MMQAGRLGGDLPLRQSLLGNKLRNGRADGNRNGLHREIGAGR